MNEAQRFSPPSVVLPSGVGRPLEDVWRAVAHLVATCLRRYGAPADLWRESAGGSRGMARGLFLLRRAQTVLRHVMLIYARHFLRDAVFAPPRARRCATHAPRRTPKADDVFRGCVAFLMPRRYRAFVRASNALQPGHLRADARNPLRVVARRMEGLRRVLDAPMPHIRRLARMLSREMLHAPYVERRRRPPAWRRDLWEELEDVRRMAWWAFSKENLYLNSS